jgi:hypothetical protein
MFDFQTLQDLSKGAAKIDVACPACGPGCRTPSNRTRNVLRIYNAEPGFATYVCARCGDKGFAHESNRSRNPLVDQSKFFKPIVSRRIPEPDVDDVEAKKKKAETARYLWQRRRRIAGSIAEFYLRQVRGYRGPLPGTLAFSPARGSHKPAMIAAFGIAQEPEPGALHIDPAAISGIHMTRLLPDGSGKDGGVEDKAKIMLGSSMGQPIVLAPCNDLLGLVIAEGIEDALSAHAASGRGAWAAGSAGRLPKLADVVPSYIECVTVLVDDDDAGNKNAKQLITKLKKGGPLTGFWLLFAI